MTPIGRRVVSRFNGRLFDLARDESGAEAVEFAIVLPVLLLVVLGGLQFGLTVANYSMLTTAVGAGARQLSLGRGSTTTPYTTAVNAVRAAAPLLSPSSLAISLSVNGTTCTADAACKTALTSAQGQPSSVSATYPCSLKVLTQDFANHCTLSASATMMVQ
jgi:Flp pilus assembly protein TadG